MSRESAVAFLRAMAQALSAMSLYQEGHPARNEALDRAHGALRDHLGQSGDEERFSFLDEEVIWGDRQLRELQDWPWSRLLPNADVERIEFERGVGRDELVRLLETVRGRLDRDEVAEATGDGDAAAAEAASEGGGDGSAAAVREPAPEGVDRAGVVDLGRLRFGPVRRHEGDWEEGEETAFEEYGLDEELDAVDWLMETARRDGSVSGLLAGAVVKSIGVALREERNAMRLLAPLKATDEYSVVHSMNAATLSMGLGEALGLSHDEVHVLGQSALLHDTGKTRLPDEILKKEGSLDDEEWERVKEHPREGARILMNSEEDMEVPALVAYEHHLWWDGSAGYPDLRYPRKPHRATQIVHVCDIYDALRTERPYRDAWSEEKVEDYLRQQAGTEFDPDCVKTLLHMIQGEDEEEG